MKYVVLIREREETKKAVWSDWKTITCSTIESALSTVQCLLIDHNKNRIRDEVQVKVFPYISEEMIVFNRKTNETRLVKQVSFDNGMITVFNTDEKENMELQDMGYASCIEETWKIEDCIPIEDPETLKNSGFRFGSAMGEHQEFDKILNEAFRNMF